MFNLSSETVFVHFFESFGTQYVCVKGDGLCLCSGSSRSVFCSVLLVHPVCVHALFGTSSTLREFSLLDDIYNFSQKKHIVEHFKVLWEVYSHSLA